MWSESNFSENLLDKDAIQKLPVQLNVLGAAFIAKNIAESSENPVLSIITSREITEWLIEKLVITTPDFRHAEKQVIQTLIRLQKRGLISVLMPKDAKEAGIKQFPKTVRKFYQITSRGIEMMRFIAPYLTLFADEMLVPISVNKANVKLKTLLDRSNFLSLSQLKKICLIKEIGDQTVVFRKLPAKEATRIFPDFPYIGFKEFIAYFKIANIPLTDKVIELLKKIFKGKEKVLWKEISWT